MNAFDFKSRWLLVLGFVAWILLAAEAGWAAAANADAHGDLAIRYATEPSTGSMVLAAVVFIAARRRARMPRVLRPRR